MLTSTIDLLDAAGTGGYAIGGFNVYNLEGVRAVVAAAEAERSPALLQVHPSALEHGGAPLIALCLEAARGAGVPFAVHLDHSDSPDAIRAALDAGVASIMADGSHLPFEENLAFTAAMAWLGHARGAAVEAELGRLAGTEDGLTVPEYAAHLTDPDQAADFVSRSGVDALAVCIGNIHGHYRGEPILDFARLERLRRSVPVPLVLHGASGLPAPMVRRAIELGVCKLNVNTEVRDAYLGALAERMAAGARPDLLDLMRGATDAMRAVVAAKLRLFGSAGKAELQ
ncbi:MAG TPA: class II fructose-bisphosphate aldolase [Roseiflexaceae bacterium]|nr:class II fructose-bisphosphate aldolase [Roseiflexaceae bacterium]